MGSQNNYIEANPFWVLELPCSASSQELGRQKQKLMSMLKLGLSAAKTFDSPSGPQPRDSFLIREAASSLEEGGSRLLYEIWSTGFAAHGETSDSPWPEMLVSVVQAHCRIRSQDRQLCADLFGSLCADWQRVLKSEDLVAAMTKRSAALRGGDYKLAKARFRSSVQTELYGLLVGTRFDLDGLQSRLALAAVGELQSECAEQLEHVSQRLHSISSWQERAEAWVLFRHQYGQVTAGRGAYLRHLSFSSTNDSVSDLASEAFESSYFSFAGKLYAWIRDEARSVGHDSEVERCTFNADLAMKRGRGRHLIEMRICPHCSCCVREGVFCSECGDRFHARFCSECGSAAARKFCSECGAAVRNAS